MKKVRFEKEIEQENIEKIIKWTNEEGSKFLEQWAGRGFSFPFDEMQFEKINKNLKEINQLIENSNKDNSTLINILDIIQNKNKEIIENDL